MHLFPRVTWGKGTLALLVAVVSGLVLAGTAVATSSNNSPSSSPGPKLLTACSGTHVWAVVNADGSLARTSVACGTTTSAPLGTGSYQVIFPRNITHCAFTASVGLASFSGSTAPGYATVVGRAGTTNGVFIQTFNSAGTLTSLGFHLIVDC